MRPSPEARDYAPVPPDSVREIRLPAGRLDPDWVTDSIGAPYETLASVEALSAGADAEGRALASMRHNVARIGGNAMLVLEVRRMPAGPYTAARGYAYRLHPPMPDAPVRCARLVEPDSAVARVVACREAARLQPDAEAHRSALVVARVALADLLQRRQHSEAQAASRDVQRAIADAWRRDSTFDFSARWMADFTRAHGGDSLRAAQAVMHALLTHGHHGGAIDVARHVIRLAPDSVAGYRVAFDVLLHPTFTDSRYRSPSEAAAVAAALVRRQPGVADGWAMAAIAAHEAGDHTRAMRLWNRVLVVAPRYFANRMDPPRGSLAYDHWRKRIPRQPPATVDDLPPAGPPGG